MFTAGFDFDKNTGVSLVATVPEATAIGYIV